MRGGFEKALRHRSKGHNLGLESRIHSPKSEDEDAEKTSPPTRVKAEER